MVVLKVIYLDFYIPLLCFRTLGSDGICPNGDTYAMVTHDHVLLLLRF